MVEIDQQEQDRRDHTEIWRRINSLDQRINELRLYVEQRSQADREKILAKNDSLETMLREFLLENTRSIERLISRTDALHVRLDQHQEVHAALDQRLEKKDEESKVIRREKRGWWWGLGAALILIMIERLIAGVLAAIKWIGGKP